MENIISIIINDSKIEHKQYEEREYLYIEDTYDYKSYKKEVEVENNVCIIDIL